jgi:hypothetical protein
MSHGAAFGLVRADPARRRADTRRTMRTSSLDSGSALRRCPVGRAALAPIDASGAR